jgi:hypothetical protein
LADALERVKRDVVFDVVDFVTDDQSDADRRVELLRPRDNRRGFGFFKEQLALLASAPMLFRIGLVGIMPTQANRSVIFGRKKYPAFELAPELCVVGIGDIDNLTVSARAS